MLKHTLLAWLFTCFAGTMILGGFFAFEEGGFKSSDMEAFVLIALAITLVTSIPAMILYGLLMAELLRRMPMQQAKLLGSVFALLATAFTFMFVFGMLANGWLNADNMATMLLGLPYALCFALAAWLIPMPELTAAPLSEGDGFAHGFPATPPPAYYIVAGIVAAILLYSLSTLFTGGLLRTRGFAWASLAMHLADLAVSVAALLLFLRWRPLGWKLMTALSAAGLVGMLLSIGTFISMLSEHGLQLWRYYIPMLIFGLLDGLALYLLARPSLRARFGLSMRDFGIWVLVGLVYALIRMGIYRLVYGA